MLDGISEPVIRFLAFSTVFLAMAIFELVAPRLSRPEMAGAWKGRRWFTNISMVVLSTLLLRLVFPAAAVGTAVWASEKGMGLFNSVSVPVILAGVLCFVILDFAVWLEHVASHKIPLLWRIHRMHHADTGFDLTTALRFHPLEILLSMVWKAAVIVLFGAPVVAVLIFEIVLNATAMFNHANAALPQRVDRMLRVFLVTPDMHRVHHSSYREETDSNYGFNLPVWDRLFGTYNDQPRDGHQDMTIGLDEFRDTNPSHLSWSLMLPFRALSYHTRTGKRNRPS